MIRVQTQTGWWLITHPDHARLAGAIATRWGNQTFLSPEPRASVLHAIHVHDDGWAVRDAAPQITRQGKPSAFSVELVGKYSAFEEIDLADYLSVRERAVEQVESTDAYAALLVSMHTYNLLTARADRSTIAPEQLPLLDSFLDRQHTRQKRLRSLLNTASDDDIENNFRLLQACDNLSLLGCVNYTEPATLLHALPTKLEGSQRVAVQPTGSRGFQLAPYPLDAPEITFAIPARHIEGHLFETGGELQKQFAAAPTEQLNIQVRR